MVNDELINGGQETANAIVVTEPNENEVDPVSMDDIKRIAKGDGDPFSNLIKKIAAGTPDVKLTYEDCVYKITDEDLEKLKKYPLIVFFAKGETGFTEAPPSSITLCKNVPDSNYFAISHISLVPNSVEGDFSTTVLIEFGSNVLGTYRMGNTGVEPNTEYLSGYYSLEFYGIE